MLITQPELKSCPFCGADAELLHYNHERARSFYYVSCAGCGVQSPLSGINDNTPDGVVDHWNRRAPQPPAPSFALDDPDNGLHARRAVDVDWNTVAALVALLQGNNTQHMRAIVQMLVQRATDALNTPAPSVPIPNEIRKAIDIAIRTRHHVLVLEMKGIRDEDIAEIKPYLDEMDMAAAWLAAQPEPPQA